jgi:hypothetical protein
MHLIAAVVAGLVPVHGQVVHPNGVPVANKTLVFVPQSGQVKRVTTDATGHFRVRLYNGPYVVRVPRILPGGFWLNGPMTINFVIR